MSRDRNKVRIGSGVSARYKVRPEMLAGQGELSIQSYG